VHWSVAVITGGPLRVRGKRSSVCPGIKKGIPKASRQIDDGGAGERRREREENGGDEGKKRKRTAAAGLPRAGHSENKRTTCEELVRTSTLIAGSETKRRDFNDDSASSNFPRAECVLCQIRGIPDPFPARDTERRRFRIIGIKKESEPVASTRAGETRWLRDFATLSIIRF